MSHNWSHIPVTPGSREDARLPDALTKSTPHLRPDAIATSFAALADTAGRPWDGLLRGEPALVVAQILAFHLEDEVQRFDLAQESGPDAAAQEIKQLADRLDDWLGRIRVQWPDAFADVLRTLDLQMALTDRTRALAQATGRDEAELAHRLMGDWTPDTTTWARVPSRAATCRRK